MIHGSSSFKNAILTRLSPAEILQLGPLERLSLPLRQSVELANSPNEFVYFLEDGLASVVYENLPGKATELGLIGSEGMTGLGIVFGDDRTPFETFMQVEGSGLRCKATNLHKLWHKSATLRRVVSRYARAFEIQTACTAVANGRYTLEERLARWLLMVSDRTGPSFRITHEFMAVMLAVRRSGVTLTIQALEGRGLVKATRGTIHVLDRGGLLALAKGSYGVPEREYARLFT